MFQDKIRSELLSVVGMERRFEMRDKPNLPYFNAAIAEIQRCANMIPFLLFHRCAILQYFLQIDRRFKKNVLIKNHHWRYRRHGYRREVYPERYANAPADFLSTERWWDLWKSEWIQARTVSRRWWKNCEQGTQFSLISSFPGEFLNIICRSNWNDWLRSEWERDNAWEKVSSAKRFFRKYFKWWPLIGLICLIGP